MENVFYLSAWSKEDPVGGIYSYILNNGVPEQIGFIQLPMSGYLTFSPDKKTLYATGAISNGEEGCVAFAIGTNGILTRRGEAASGGKSCCHCGVAPDGKFLYAADYSSGDLAEFALDETGDIVERTQKIQHEGHGPNVKRQECAHVHFTAATPDGKFIAVVDLGIDQLRCYPYTPGKGIDAANPVISVMKPGSGPRHLVFNAAGDLAYLVNELGNTVTSLAYKNGKFTVIEDCDLLTPQAGITKAGAIRMSPDGRFLVATNRGFDSLVTIALDGKGGMKRQFIQISGGSSPRDVNFLPGGKHFAGANEFSDNVFFYDYDPATAAITPNGVMLTMPRPLCIVF